MLTDQQQIAVESVDKNVLMAAGAGSGKTHVLVERYVEILTQDLPHIPWPISSPSPTRARRHLKCARASEAKISFLSKDSKEVERRQFTCAG